MRRVVLQCRCPLVALDTRRTHYRGTLDTARLGQDTQLCPAVGADMPALELVAAVPLRFKVGSPDDIEPIVVLKAQATAIPALDGMRELKMEPIAFTQ